MQSVDVCAWLTCSVVFAALGWFSKKAQPGQLFCGLLRGALVGCVVPRVALTRGGKSKKTARGDGPLAHNRADMLLGCWLLGRQSSHTQGSMQNRWPKRSPGSGVAVTARASLFFCPGPGREQWGAPPSASKLTENQPKQTMCVREELGLFFGEAKA